MAKTVKFPPDADESTYDGVMDQLGPNVFVRERWSDDWTEVQNLYALEVTWSVAPTLPVATLEMDYGFIRQSYRTYDDDDNEEFGPAEVVKTDATDLVGQFVKIECVTNYSENLPLEGNRYWYGVIEEAHDEQGGVDEATGLCYGRVTLVAYGMEKLLADHQILTAQCEGGVHIGIPLDFNRAGPKGVVGNRSFAKFLASYLFSTKPSTAATWSSRQIVEYLLLYETPKDQTEAGQIFWYLDTPSEPFVCDDDTPLLKCESATTYSLLCQLLDRRRGVVWWCEVDEGDGETDASIYIKANSIVPEDVVGNKMQLPKNSDPLDIEYDSDPLTNVVLNNSDLPRYQQVVVQGPRIRCVGTFSAEDDTLESAWDDEEEEAYEAGGTPHPDNTPPRRKQERNDAARRVPKLANVYSLFRVPEDWDFQVGDGLGGDKNPMFLDANAEEQDQCYLELCFEQTMPILEGTDYEGTVIPAGQVAVGNETLNEQEMRPLCFFRKPHKTTEPYKYQPCEGVVATLERIDPKSNERIQCYLSVPQHTMTVRLNVQGEPQHAIAFADFTPINHEDPAVGEIDWRQAVFTLSIESQFRMEAKWPDDPYVSDAVRRKLIYAGDQYYRHYVAPNTVIGIDKDGYLVRSDGGWIPTLGAPEDPLPYLKDIAEIAGAWYTEHHYVLTIESYRLKPKIDICLGSLVLSAGGGPEEEDGHKKTVNAPITEIRFSYPRGAANKTPPARMQIRTWAGELDAVDFVAIKPPDPARAMAPMLARIAAREQIDAGR